MTLFTVIGLMTINPKQAYPLSVATKQPPSLKYPFGTDFFGRNLLAAMVVGMWQTAVIGVIAGGLGTLIGVVLGFTSAYFGGWIDSTIRTICQILTPIPVLLIQVVVAGSLDKRDVTIVTMALIVVMLAWMGPTLVIRAQVLTMKERQFVAVAKLSGVSKGMLVQIEQGKTNPSIGTLCKIANALGVAVSKFIETSEAPAVRLISPEEATQLWTGRNGSAGNNRTCG